MSLTKKQEQGRKIAMERFQQGEKYTTIAGLAGSGKTYLSKTIIESLGLKDRQFLVGAFTGKAALRLQENGFPQARTLHKIFYRTMKIPGIDDFIHVPKDKSDFNQYKVILIDEVSMVPDSMLRVIAKTNLHVINIGDPFQLPPIGKDNGMLGSPHIFLDEIVRQSEDSSIIRLAHNIRNREPLSPFSDSHVKMYPKEELTTGMLEWADQVLCGKNETRKDLNNIIRQSKGFTGTLPKDGEKIIFTQNNWEFLNPEGNPIINGLIGYASNTSTKASKDRKAAMFGEEGYFAYLDFTPDFGGQSFEKVKFDALPFLRGEESYMNFKAKGRDRMNKIDFGYAITTHKAQGSEYGKCLGIEERMRGTDHARWLYTMVTRCKDQLVLVYDPTSSIWK